MVILLAIRPNRNNEGNYVIANQVSESISNQTHVNIEDFMQTLNPAQYHLMNMLSSHLAFANTTPKNIICNIKKATFVDKCC